MWVKVPVWDCCCQDACVKQQSGFFCGHNDYIWDWEKEELNHFKKHWAKVKPSSIIFCLLQVYLVLICKSSLTLTWITSGYWTDWDSLTLTMWQRNILSFSGLNFVQIPKVLAGDCCYSFAFGHALSNCYFTERLPLWFDSLEAHNTVCFLTILSKAYISSRHDLYSDWLKFLILFDSLCYRSFYHNQLYEFWKQQFVPNHSVYSWAPILNLILLQ